MTPELHGSFLLSCSFKRGRGYIFDLFEFENHPKIHYSLRKLEIGFQAQSGFEAGVDNNERENVFLAFPVWNDWKSKILYRVGQSKVLDKNIASSMFLARSTLGEKTTLTKWKFVCPKSWHSNALMIDLKCKTNGYTTDLLPTEPNTRGGATRGPNWGLR